MKYIPSTTDMIESAHGVASWFVSNGRHRLSVESREALGIASFNSTFRWFLKKFGKKEVRISFFGAKVDAF